MRITAALQGNLDKYLRTELNRGERAVTGGVKTATIGLKLKLRQQTASLGIRLAKAWRGDAYPQRGASLDAAGFVYTKAQRIMASFEYAPLITAQSGFWLAIPTQYAPKRVAGKRVTPALLSKRLNLYFVKQRHGKALLVRKPRGKIRGEKTVMFWLVRQVKMPKRIHFASTAALWHQRLPSLILQHWTDKEIL